MQAAESALFSRGVANFVALAGKDSGLLQVVPLAETPRPLHDLVSGQPFFVNGGGRCSIGFCVTGGFVTAGHCGKVGDSTTGYNGVAQGTFAGSSFPGNDHAWIKVNSSVMSGGSGNRTTGGTTYFQPVNEILSVYGLTLTTG